MINSAFELGEEMQLKKVEYILSQALLIIIC